MNLCRRWLAGLLIVAASVPATSGASLEQQWNFRVYLDDRDIGYHRFQLTRQGEMLHVSSEARFQVRFLGISLYSYTHANRETWNDRCLERIAAVTDDNGKHYQIDGTANEDGFLLETLEGKKTLPPCISTFSYWDKSILGNTGLLNSQTGEYLDVSSRFQGREIIDTGNKKIAALRYRLENADFNIDLWYSENDEWLALESTTGNGRVLRYIIE